MQRGPGGGGGGGDRGGPGGPGGPGGGGEQGAVRVELYLQTFNLFNTVNYNRFASVVSSPTFGQPINALPARRFEMGMRVGF
jgi:hypothetical protein